MRFTIVFFLGMLIAGQASAQFWFGPKFGMQLSKNAYQDKGYSNDYKIAQSLTWHAGFAMQYTTDRKFAVHTELIYQQLKNSITNLPSDPELLSESSHNIISVPMLGRYTMFYAGPFSVYAMAGPRLSYWIGGSGNLFTQEGLDADGLDGGPYDVGFSPSPGGIGDGVLSVSKPNRLQYGLDLGIGTVMDLASGQRVSFELRYSKGHSHMALGQEKLLEGASYSENYRYANNQLMASIGFLFGYDPSDKRKGSSTNKLSNKTK